MKQTLQHPIQALERRCDIPAGTLETIGLESVARIVGHTERDFIRKFRTPLGSGSKAKLLYRCAWTAKRYMAFARVTNGKDVGQIDSVIDPRAKLGAPDWSNQFPRAVICAPAGSVGDATSPAAYAVALYQQALYWESVDSTAPSASNRNKLASRRPDIANTPLDEVSMTKPTPKIQFVNTILGTYVDQNKSILENIMGLLDGSGGKDVPAEVLISRLPFPGTELPYHEAYDQALQSVLEKNLTFYKILNVSDPVLPPFLKYIANSGTEKKYTNQYQAAQLSPSQFSLLMAPAMVDTEDNDIISSYCNTYFGVATIEAATRINYFPSVTGIGTTEMRAMLCVSGSGPNATTVGTTKNYTGYNFPPNATFYGASYISAGAPIYIEAVNADLPAAAQHIVSSNNSHLGLAALDRINRIYRLKIWSGLEFHKLDNVLHALANNINRTHIPPNAPYIDLDKNTLRAIGLYKELSADFGMHIDDFCVLLSSIQAQSVGDNVNQFDAVFNSKQQTVLCLGGGEYVYNEPSDLVSALCAALQLDLASFNLVAELVSGTQKCTTNYLNRTIACYTSLYRISMLSRYLKINVAGLFALLERTPNGAYLRNGLASEYATTNAAKPTFPAPSDYIDWLYELSELVLFLRDSGMPVEVFINLVPSYATNTFANTMRGTRAEELLVSEVSSALSAVSFDVAVISTIDLPKKDDSTPSKTIDWVTVLNKSSVVDKGIIIIKSEAGRQTAIANSLKTQGYKVTNEASYISLMNMLTESKAAQDNLADNSLGRYFSTNRLLLHQMIDSFDGSDAEGNSAKFLSYCNSISISGPPDANASDSTVQLYWTKLMNLLSNFARQEVLVKKYSLSMAGLAALSEPAKYFGIDISDDGWAASFPLSTPTLYALEAYAQWLQSAEREDDVLQYLKDVNATTKPLSATDASAILADQLNVDKVQIQSAADWVTAAAAGKGVIKNVTQMAQVMALLGMCNTAGLTVGEFLNISTLPITVQTLDSDHLTDAYYNQWQTAAYTLLSALNTVPSE